MCKQCYPPFFFSLCSIRYAGLCRLWLVRFSDAAGSLLPFIHVLLACIPFPRPRVYGPCGTSCPEKQTSRRWNESAREDLCGEHEERFMRTHNICYNTTTRPGNFFRLRPPFHRPVLDMIEAPPAIFVPFSIVNTNIQANIL